MEPSQTEDELFVPGVYMDDVSATLHHGGGVALTQSVIMKVEDSDTTVRWEEYELIPLSQNALTLSYP